MASKDKSTAENVIIEGSEIRQVNLTAQAEENVVNIDQSKIQAASIRAEDVIVTRSIIGEMSNTAESVNIEGRHINQVTVATTEANIVGATIGTVVVQGGGGAQEERRQILEELWRAAGSSKNQYDFGSIQNPYIMNMGTVNNQLFLQMQAKPSTSQGEANISQTKHDEATEEDESSPSSAESTSGSSLPKKVLWKQIRGELTRVAEEFRLHEEWERQRDEATAKDDPSPPSAESTSGSSLTEKGEWQRQREKFHRETEKFHRETEERQRREKWLRQEVRWRRVEPKAGVDSTESTEPMPGPSSAESSKSNNDDKNVPSSATKTSVNAASVIMEDSRIGEVNIQGGSVDISQANIRILNYIVTGSEGGQVPSAESDSSVIRPKKSGPVNQKDWFSFLDEQNRRFYEKKDSALRGIKGKKIKEKNPWVHEVPDLYKGELLEKKTQLKKEESLIPDENVPEDLSDVESEEKDETEQYTTDPLKEHVAEIDNIPEEDDDVTSSSDKLNYEALVKYIMESDKKHIALIGEAGAGKTTLVNRLVRDVTAKRRPQSHPVVFRLFSGFAKNEKTTPCKMLFEGTSRDSSVHEDCYQWMLDNEENLIFFFDGLDQAMWSIDDTEEIFPYGEATPQVIMSNIFRKSLFPNAKVVYASRESSVAALNDDHRPDAIFALAGLSLADAKYLFTSMVGKKGEEAWKKLVTQSNPIVSLLTTPALLSFAAVVYNDKPGNLPRNATGLMQSLLQHFTKSRHTRNTKVKQVLPHLRTTSYNGIKNRKVIFEKDDFKLSEEDIQFLVSKIPGPGIGSFKILDGEWAYYFSHQYVQEFFGAEHIIARKLLDFMRIVPEELSAYHWSIVAKFVAGILKGKDIIGAPIEDLQQKREIFREMVTHQYQAGANRLEVLTTIAESEDAKLIRGLVDEIVLKYLPISAARMYAISSVMRHCNTLTELNFKGCGISAATVRILINSLKNSKVKIRKMDISRNASMEVRGFQDMMRLAAQCEVKELDTAFCGLQEEHFSSLNETDIQYLKLKRVDLSGNCMFDASFEVIGSILDDGSELHLVQCSITNSELETLQEALGKKSISHLDISSNAISVEGCATIGKIAKQSGIDKLLMRGCSLTDVSLEAFRCEAEGAKITWLDIAWNEVGIEGSAIVGKIAKQLSVSTLALVNCKLSAAALGAFLSEAKGAEIACLDISWNGIGIYSAEIVAEIANLCSVRDLAMRRCALSQHSLHAFLDNIKGEKISSLDISGNEINDDAAVIVGKLTKRCMCETLIMRHCDLREESLFSFLYHARGSKLLLLNLTGNDLPQSAEEEIKRHVSVKKIKLDQTEPSTHEPARPSEATEMSSSAVSPSSAHQSTDFSSTPPTLRTRDPTYHPSRCFSVEKAIGPEGGCIELFGCRILFPPKVFKTVTIVKITIRSIYDDALEGYIVISPEFECSITFGVSFEGVATISLPIHVIPRDGRVTVMTKQDQNANWRVMDVNTTIEKRRVSFQVSHFTIFKLLARLIPGLTTYLCHNVYFNASTSQLLGVTSVDDETEKAKWLQNITEKGFENVFPIPDLTLSLCWDDVARYSFMCDAPKELAVQPIDEVVLTRNDFKTNSCKQRSFLIQPPLSKTVAVADIQYLIKIPDESEDKHFIRLNWKPAATDAQAQSTSRGSSSRPTSMRQATAMQYGRQASAATGLEAGPGASSAPTQEEIRATDPVHDVDVRRSSRQFYNLHVRSQDAYRMDPNRVKGNVLIINNEFLRKANRRHGSLVDVENLENLWNQLGFQVTTKRNLKGRDMRCSCREFAQDSVDINVLVLIIMSHGGKRDGKEVICGEDDQKVSTEQIISYFTSENSPHLQGIPKVLMFQACRGEDLDQNVEELSLDADEGPDRYPERSDMLIVYPSQAGYASFRNRDTGSWLMNAVTTVFMRDAKDTHVLDMLTKVNRAISLKEYDGYVQMSNQVNYLTKNLFLFPGWPN